MRRDIPIVKPRLMQGLPMAILLVMALIAIAGPSGLLAWGESQRMLDQRKVTLVDLQAKRSHLQNKVKLLDSHNADPDLVGELLRRNLNVARPDEKVLLLP